jgi:amino acid transporter
LAHIRFRIAWKHQGHTLDEIPFKAMFGIWGSYAGLVLIVLVLIAQVYPLSPISYHVRMHTNIAQFYTALYPLGKDGIGTAEDFFKSYLALPVVVVFWVCGYFWKRAGWLRTSQIDVDTGRREVNWDLINATKAEIASYPAWKRLFYFLF